MPQLSPSSIADYRASLASHHGKCIGTLKAACDGGYPAIRRYIEQGEPLAALKMLAVIERQCRETLGAVPRDFFEPQTEAAE